jgi:hypothetical protein
MIVIRKYQNGNLKDDLNVWLFLLLTVHFSCKKKKYNLYQPINQILKGEK